MKNIVSQEIEDFNETINAKTYYNFIGLLECVIVF